jgi:benzoyl-CoA reductase subunit B
MGEKVAVNRIRSMSVVNKAIDDFYKELSEAPERGRKICWQEGFVFQPFLRAMDVAQYWTDTWAATTSARGFAGPLIEHAEQSGYNRDLCSYGRVGMGTALLGPDYVVDPERQWRVPKPDFIALGDAGCSMTFNMVDAYRNFFEVPHFTLESTYLWDNAAEDEAVNYTVQQLNEFIKFLEEMCGRRFDWDGFNRAVQCIYEAALLRKQGQSLCAARPAPASYFDWGGGVGVLSYLLGRPESVTAAKAMKQEIEERVAKKEGVIPNERCRLYFEGFMCWPKMGFLSRTLAPKGALVVAGRYTHLMWYPWPELYDPSRPMEFLARNLVRVSINRNIDTLIDLVSEVCRQQLIDGLVVFYARTCRPFVGFQGDVGEGVSRRLGIPFVVLEGDHADEKAWADAQVATRLDALVETIAAQKRAAGKL